MRPFSSCKLLFSGKAESRKTPYYTFWVRWAKTPYVDDGEFYLGPTPLRGHQAIYEWGRHLVEAPPWRCICYVCGNMRFRADGPNAAEGTTVLTVYMVAGPEAATVPWSVGEDHDRFVRTEQGWRFASRRWVELFSRGDIVNLP